ncbi:hypothetical protein ACFOHY_04680 [Rhizobium rosettiformans]
MVILLKAGCAKDSEAVPRGKDKALWPSCHRNKNADGIGPKDS